MNYNDNNNNNNNYGLNDTNLAKKSQPKLALLLVLTIFTLIPLIVSTNVPWSKLPNTLIEGSEEIDFINQVEYYPKRIYLILLIISIISLGLYGSLVFISMVIKKQFSKLFTILQIIPIIGLLFNFTVLILSFTFVQDQHVLVIGGTDVEINITLAGGSNSQSLTSGGFAAFSIAFFFNTILVALNICYIYLFKQDYNNNEKQQLL
ncbi:hypothetical protein DICPUDRAFT_74996 [Dictyostelium purpureum]|uniref:Uncharacterized protein n=1 Tax=Dictyostelium purpureum TaxID=5786 RepID=F0Z9C2_DICPU|nr:uncharacterized protein DICPUDRAFT_74996 [Dictyostelium purpureum]EGC39445.1 hypothetical protein DICPUDRAFT_74996 [Dictyostelium purpureum]|eukprot:XP_003284003.1 hypothetical protein DICPUDRAFT_74996 [Dictyostelium purpureum]